MALAQPVDAHSSKSALIPPTPADLARLAQQSRVLHLPNVNPGATIPPRSLRRRLSRQEIAEIVSRYQAGDGTPRLCRDFGLSKGGILQLLRSEGVLMRKQAITPADADHAARLYDSGMSITEIVEQIGYSYSTVRKSLHASGVAMRPKGIKRRPMQ